MKSENSKIIIGLKHKELEFTGEATRDMFDILVDNLEKNVTHCVLKNENDAVMIKVSEITDLQWGFIKTEGGK